MDPGTLLVAEQTISTTVEAAALAAVGLAQKTHPLSASFTRITSEAFLPRSSHTLNIIGGKAYIFGGRGAQGRSNDSSDRGEEKLSGNEVHIVRLPVQGPSVGEGDVDYQCVPALGEEDRSNGQEQIPVARAAHGAYAIGRHIYVFGGQSDSGEPLDEKGRVWVFNVESLRWSYLDPKPGSAYPKARFSHGFVGTPYPPSPESSGNIKALGTKMQESISDKIPSLVNKPNHPSETHGILFLSSGLSSSPPKSKPLTDTWAFEVASQTWTQLPSLPSTPTASPGLAIANDILYVITHSSSLDSEIHSLSIPKSSPLASVPHEADFRDVNLDHEKNFKDDANNPRPLPTWHTHPFPTNPLSPGPRPRTGAGLLSFTTGNGRNYLLYFFGQKDSTVEDKPEFWSDAYTYQPPASFPSPARTKDQTRGTLGIESGENTWAEVKVVANEEEKGRKEGEGKSHPGPRGWFACDDVGGSEFVLWGGKDAKGDVMGDGWLIKLQ